MTAEEFFIENYPEFDDLIKNGQPAKNIYNQMTEFAKYHHKQQLEAIRKNVTLTDFAWEFLQEGATDAIDYDSIDNAYPIENIK